MTWDAPDSFDEAVDWFRDRIPIPDDEFDQLVNASHDQSFTIAGVAQLDVVNDVWDAIETALTTGSTLDDFKESVGELLEQSWSGTVDDPSFRMETIFRTNVQSAYGAGRYTQMKDPAVAKTRPYWMFDAIVDKDTSKICQACGQPPTVLPSDDPWWSTHYPPLHFNCRSLVTTLTEDQAKKRGITTNPTHEHADDGFGKSPGGPKWEPNADDYPAPLFDEFEKKDDDEKGDDE